MPHVRSRDHSRFCAWWKWVGAGGGAVAVCFFVAVTLAFLALFCGGGGRVGCGYRSVVCGLVCAALEQLQRCSRCARSVAIKAWVFVLFSTKRFDAPRSPPPEDKKVLVNTATGVRAILYSRFKIDKQINGVKA